MLGSWCPAAFNNIKREWDDHISSDSSALWSKVTIQGKLDTSMPQHFTNIYAFCWNLGHSNHIWSNELPFKSFPACTFCNDPELFSSYTVKNVPYFLWSILIESTSYTSVLSKFNRTFWTILWGLLNFITVETLDTRYLLKLHPLNLTAFFVLELLIVAQLARVKDSAARGLHVTWVGQIVQLRW